MWDRLWRRLRSLRVLAGFVGASMGNLAVGLLCNVFALRWTEPYYAGIWQSLTLIQSYMVFVTIGVFSGLAREYPLAIGQNKRDTANRVAASAYAFSTITSLLIGAGFIIAAIFSSDGAWFFGFFSWAIVATTGHHRNYLLVTYRSASDFGRLSRLLWFESVALVLSMPLIYWWGFYGLCARAALTGVLMTGALQIGRPVRVSMRQSDWSSLRQLIRVGGPTLAISSLSVFSMGFERIILLRHGGIKELGLYAPATAMRTALVAIPAAINQYVTPKMAHLVGTGANFRQLWHVASRSIFGTALLLLPIGIIGYVLLPLIITTIFPKYAAAIAASRWVLASCIFFAIQAGTPVLSMLRAWRPWIVFAGVEAACLWWIPTYFVNHSDTVLLGVSLGGFTARAAIFVVGLCAIYLAARAAPCNGSDRIA